jgi:hypothetical protein
MFQSSDQTLSAFRVLYPEIPDQEIPTAYDAFCRYAQLAIEVSGASPPEDLTNETCEGTVSTGSVEPSRTFTNTG